ncbi:MAG TPA: AsmA family protein, partial [Verrucomicrobiae bacterium]|nr:AsmA family protein [Verrucomicrobiae bacterium]
AIEPAAADSSPPIGANSPQKTKNSGRRLVVWGLGLLGAVALLLAGAVLLLVTVDLRPWIEEYGSSSFERPMTIGTLRIGWGDPLSLELRDLRLANAAWGSSAEMVRIESVTAEIDPWSLFGGPIRFEKLEVIKPVIVLERDANGLGNWKIGKIVSSSERSASRSQFPTLIELTLRGGNVSFRTTSGNWLRVALDDLEIRSGGADRPLTITLDGAYNDLQAKLTADAQSFDALRDTSRPYGIDFSIASASTSIEFKGTLQDPLGFDGVLGSLAIDAKKLDGLLRIFGAESGIDPPVHFAGDLQRQEDHWQLSAVQGELGGSAFSGGLVLDEAPRGQPDDVGFDLAFPKLDLDPLMKGADGADSVKIADWRNLSLRVEEKRGTNIAWHIAARLLKYGKMRVLDVDTHGRLASGAIALEQLKFALAGGSVDVSGSVKNAANGGHMAMVATLAGIDAAQLAGIAGGEAGQISGRLDGGLTLDMTGNTVKSALKMGNGHIVLAVTEAHIARDLIERISTDLRTLFRTQEDMVQLTCLLGIVDLQNGIGAIWPLRLRTSDGTIVGKGQVDFLAQRLDLIIQSVAASTSFFALDVPVEISGEFRDLHVLPGAASAEAPGDIDPLHGLPRHLRRLAERNACLHAGE